MLDQQRHLGVRPAGQPVQVAGRAVAVLGVAVAQVVRAAEEQHGLPLGQAVQQGLAMQGEVWGHGVSDKSDP